MAPEVISLEFAFFDGTQWLTQWDSSTQSLPWLVQINLAMQSASGLRAGKLEPGTQISMLSLDDRQQYGVQIYELVVAIPGAQLRAADAATADQAAGMDSVGMTRVTRALFGLMTMFPAYAGGRPDTKKCNRQPK